MQTEKHVVMFRLCFPMMYAHDILIKSVLERKNWPTKMKVKQIKRNAEMVEMKFELNISTVRKK